MGYSAIERSTWQKLRSYTRDERDLFLYLLANHHMEGGGGRLGAYVLDPWYAVADVSCADDEWTPSRVQKTLEQLQARDRIVWDRENRVVLLVRFFKFSQNWPSNPNGVSAVVAAVQALPPSVPVLRRLRAAVDEYVPATFENDKHTPRGSAIVEAIDERLAAATGEPVHKGSARVPEGLPDNVSNQSSTEQNRTVPGTVPGTEPNQNRTEISALRAVAAEVGDFCVRLGCEWKLSDAIADWSAELERDARYAGVDIAHEIRRCREWHEGKRKKPKAPDQAIRNWLKRAAEDARGQGAGPRSVADEVAALRMMLSAGGDVLRFKGSREFGFENIRMKKPDLWREYGELFQRLDFPALVDARDEFTRTKLLTEQVQVLRAA